MSYYDDDSYSEGDVAAIFTLMVGLPIVVQSAIACWLARDDRRSSKLETAKGFTLYFILGPISLCVLIWRLYVRMKKACDESAPVVSQNVMSGDPTSEISMTEMNNPMRIISKLQSGSEGDVQLEAQKTLETLDGIMPDSCHAAWDATSARKDRKVSIMIFLIQLSFAFLSVRWTWNEFGVAIGETEEKDDFYVCRELVCDPGSSEYACLRDGRVSGKDCRGIGKFDMTLSYETLQEAGKFMSSACYGSDLDFVVASFMGSAVIGVMIAKDLLEPVRVWKAGYKVVAFLQMAIVLPLVCSLSTMLGTAITTRSVTGMISGPVGIMLVLDLDERAGAISHSTLRRTPSWVIGVTSILIVVLVNVLISEKADFVKDVTSCD